MDTRSIGAIIIKITGLVMIVVALIQVPAYFPLTSRGYDFSIGETLGFAALSLGPLALAGLLLWFFPGSITNRIVSGPATTSSAADFRSLELVALTCIGIFLLANGIISTVRDTVIVIVLTRRTSASDLIPASIIGHIAAAIAELAIGAALCVGAKGVSSLVERLRR